MRVSITTEFVRKLPQKNVDIWDTRFRGLVLRCRASGTHTYRVSYGRGKWVTLGRPDVLTPDEARVKARGVLGDVSKGHDPAPRRKADPTLSAYLTDTYGPWVQAQRKSGAITLGRLKTVFGTQWGNKRLSTMTPFAIESWRSRRLKAGLSRETVNRDLAALKAALGRAVAWKIITVHPLAGVKLLPVDQQAGIVRYLTGDEERRLLAALASRDDARRTERERSNAWRRERGYAEWPPFGPYTDHVTPLVLTALHTGLRRGELLSLRWADVTLDPPARASLCVRGASAKSGRTRHVPLNSIILAALTTWRTAQAPAAEEALMFAVATGIKTSWKAVMTDAKVSSFRFHDCRHHFASKLVMAGVDLNTVRELLGHSTLMMTLRYAHLAPEHKAAAVAKLVNE